MNTAFVLAFLSQHQPMSSESEMTEEEFEGFVSVLAYLRDQPVPESIPLLFSCLTDSAPPALAMEVAYALESQDRELVIDELAKALADGAEWAAELAKHFPSLRLGTVIRMLLQKQRQAGQLTMRTLDFASSLHWVLLQQRQSLAEDEIGNMLQELHDLFFQILDDSRSSRGLIVSAALGLHRLADDFDYPPARKAVERYFGENGRYQKLRGAVDRQRQELSK